MLKKMLILTSIAIGIAGLFNTECEASSRSNGGKSKISTCTCTCSKDVKTKKKRGGGYTTTTVDEQQQFNTTGACTDTFCNVTCADSGYDSGEAS